jgi:hypothetical protein
MLLLLSWLLLLQVRPRRSWIVRSLCMLLQQVGRQTRLLLLLLLLRRPQAAGLLRWTKPGRRYTRLVTLLITTLKGSQESSVGWTTFAT